MQEFSFQVFEAFTAATIIYIVINIVVVVRHALASSAASRCRAIIGIRRRRRPAH